MQLELSPAETGTLLLSAKRQFLNLFVCCKYLENWQTPIILQQVLVLYFYVKANDEMAMLDLVLNVITSIRVYNLTCITV